MPVRGSRKPAPIVAACLRASIRSGYHFPVRWGVTKRNSFIAVVNAESALKFRIEGEFLAFDAALSDET